MRLYEKKGRGTVESANSIMERVTHLKNTAFGESNTDKKQQRFDVPLRTSFRTV